MSDAEDLFQALQQQYDATEVIVIVRRTDPETGLRQLEVDSQDLDPDLALGLMWRSMFYMTADELGLMWDEDEEQEETEE